MSKSNRTTAILSVFRFDPEADSRPRFQQYTVAVRPGETVLEALFDVLENQDGSLAFRYACRGAVCGSCAMHISGKYRLACQSQMSDLPGTVVVQPLSHVKVIKDLVVDMGPFFRAFEHVMPYLVNETPPPEKERLQSVRDRKKIDEVIDCILCGCCYASCPMTQTDPEYLGPAAILQADRFLSDSRDQARWQRLKRTDGEHGVWRCHTIFNCAVACPKNLNPTESIAKVKRRLIFDRLFGWAARR